MKTKLTYSVITALALVGAATFIGCSSSGGSTDSTATATLEGTFVDSAVQGLTYKGNLSGTTDAGGHYSFKGSERVEFLLGNSLSLGTLVPKTSQVSVLDFFDGQLTVSDTKVQKLIVLLQSLDSDGDTTNGITISADTIALLESLLAAAPYNVTDLSTFDFTSLTMTDLTSLLTALVAATPDDPENPADTDVVVNPDDAEEHFTETLYGPQPPVSDLNGSLACTADGATGIVLDATDYNASQTVKQNVSSRSADDENRQNATSHNSIRELAVVVPERTADGTLTGSGKSFHPIVVDYGQQVVGDYEMGDGSADIGDPTHRDALFLGISLDNGDTWRNEKISNSEDKNSTQVVWDGTTIAYSGHVQKPKIAVAGNNILLAWHDKYCPSGNPFNLEAVTTDTNTTYPSDFFSVNGSQGSIDYTDENGTVMIAPNGKEVYEVPFSCVWTARGFFNPTDGNITWHAPMQLTTGKRDSNHIWVEGTAAGFAMAWQEDTKGLRSGKGAGPGDGWSGATTNHGTDIWYTSIKMSEFTENNGTIDETAKLHSKYNFHYPVRITDNEKCADGDTKAYCQVMCDTYGYETSTSNNNQETEIRSCKTYDVDMLDNTQVVLNGDTGASRSALKLLTTTEGQTVVILGYEETKGLSENTTGTGDQTQGEDTTLIEFEGKSVYFESFNFNAIDDFNGSDPDTLLKVAMPLVSAGNIINMKVPEENNTSNMIFENARRLVIGTQIDSCDADKFNFAFMYKQSFDTQGASSDMFIRVNNGFTYASFVPLSNAGIEYNTTNVSAQNVQLASTDGTITDYNVSWSTDNLDDNTYENSYENTYSPRIFLRGNNIFTGFEYTPNDVKTVAGHMPSNFHTHIYMNDAWQGPVNVSNVTRGSETTVDARFFSTPKGVYNSTGLASDASNPNVLFVTWGTVDLINQEDPSLGKVEEDLFYKRAIFDDASGTWIWDAEQQMLAARDTTVIEEKEVESYASPDGKTFYNVWLQQSEEYNSSDHFSGLDTWFGRVDYNISNIAPD